MKFFILAGGYGTRAHPLSLFKPKPALPLHGTPLILILVRQLYDLGLESGFVNLHHKPREIRDIPGYPAHIHWLYEEKLTGSLVLKRVLDDMDDSILIANGDVFLQIPLQSMAEQLNDGDTDGVILVRTTSAPGYPAILIENGYYAGRDKGAVGPRLMYTGTALLKKNVIERIDAINFFDTLDGGSFKIKPLVHEGLWMDIGSPSLYFKANGSYKEHIGAAESNSLSQNVSISGDSRVTNSILWENTVIGEGCRISDCIVTGHLALKNAVYQNKIISGDHIYPLD